ncbi:MAG: hypothetical protein NW218_11565 [Saprospiraceae bacterium]|nr:hypothetical protein [Saprospiraceae bacterium]
MKKNNVFLFSLLFSLFYLQAGAQVVFMKTLGTSTTSLEEARKIIRTPDGNYLVVGYIADDANSLNRDALVFKVSSNGVILWEKKYGGANWEEFYDVVYQGGYYYCVGYTRTWVKGTNGSPNNLNADVFLVKLGLDGTIAWAKNMGRPSNGTSATDGNDIGLSLTGAAQGGVVIGLRINSGNNTNQNTGMLWVDANGRTKWAYQFDTPNNSVANELTYGIWQDANRNFITGGYYNDFITSSSLMYKVNDAGTLLWSRKNKANLGAAGVFDSQYFGFYSNKTGKIYSTDFFNQTTSSIREAQVMTNKSSDGTVPPNGTIPKARRFYYGSPNNANDNYRGIVMPTGDGQDEFILTFYSLNAANGTTRYATVVSMTTDLVVQWSRQIGFANLNNQINSIVTCEGNSKDLVAVGTVTNTSGNKDILLVRFPSSPATSASCALTDNSGNDTLGITSAAYALSRINLNTTNCSPCWADNKTISGVTVTTTSLSETSTCTTPPPMLPAEYNYIDPLACPDAGCAENLKISINQQPQELYFEITDLTGDYVYERLYATDKQSIENVKQKLASGYTFAEMGLKKGTYVWEVEAIYEGLKGMERKTGEITMQ